MASGEANWSDGVGPIAETCPLRCRGHPLVRQCLTNLDKPLEVEFPAHSDNPIRFRCLSTFLPNVSTSRSNSGSGLA